MLKRTFLATAAIAAIAGAAGAQTDTRPAAQAPVATPAQTPAPPPREPTMRDRVDQVVRAVTGSPLAEADIDMKHVLDAMAELRPMAIENLTPLEARLQPTPADAVKLLLTKEGRNAAPEPGVAVKDITFQGTTGPLPARVYRPDDAGQGPLPVIAYFHGGGWVIADLDTYDATPRALAKQARAIVVSFHYRQAPEDKFPAAHDDAIAAYRWLLQNAQQLGGDDNRIALAGESAGGNLAINVAIAARDGRLKSPVHQLLVYPVAQGDMNTKSYRDNAAAKPLNKAMMDWFLGHATRGPADLMDPRLDLVNKADLKNLPPTTIITAQIDPLRDDGAMLAAKLKEAGVPVNHTDYQGVTHEFFGMAAVVADAKAAQDVAVKDLQASFGAAATGTNPAPR